ncbi:MAG TPA: site-specific integrase [Gammaproteobacteria bacterium]|nr:site-specific integrase [Candidatus Neomarinimicrobiota bacterium]HIJ26054.1 site-specific integrase [Gammaproteobacteria bacterium]HIJ48182.1 site-specific integrase [Gammaproteobacteria bacterium]
MGSITKRGEMWRAQVEKNGVRVSMSFKVKVAALDWVRVTEQRIIDNLPGNKSHATMAEALDRYRLEEAPKKRGEKWEITRINGLLKRLNFLGRRLSEVQPSDIAEYRDERLQSVSPATVKREMIQLSSIFGVAIREWGWCSENPMQKVRRPKNSPPRSRTINKDELDLILQQLKYRPGDTPTKSIHYIGAALCFALETALRKGEILQLESKDINLERRFVNVLHDPDQERFTKTEESRLVPLTQQALLIVAPLLKESGKVFEVNLGSSDTLFRKAVKRCNIQNLHFHDSRRTALSKLAKIFSAVDLAKISGHKDLNLLLNTYYKVEVDDLVAQLD